MTDTPETIPLRKFVNRGPMLVNTEALDIDDDDHPYNQIKSMGLRPEDYGVQHPLTEEFATKSREELIDEIIDLRRTVLAHEKWL
jgi:hypothetical protein